MRTIAVLIAPLIALLALVLAGPAAAQSSGHGVAVTIPEVLRLRIDPGARRLELVAGGRWQLSASYAPAGDGTGSAPPAWSLGDGWNTFRSWDAVVAEGAETCGWRPVDIAYGPSTRASDAIDRGVIVFTLARP